MPRIPENDAAAIVRSFEAMDETQRAQALDILAQYRDQQSDLGEPQWPTQDKAAQDYTNRLRGMFKDIKTVDSVAPSLTAILPYSQNPDADRARVANTAYMAQRYGKTPEEISASYDLYRNDYAQRFLQAPTGLDDLGFHKAAAQEIQKTELKEGAELDGIKAAFRGDDVVPALQAWQAKNTDRLPDSTEFTRGFLKARETSGDHLEFADKLLKQIEGNTGLTKGEGEQRPKAASRESAADFEQSLAALADMKPKDRKQVYAIIGAKAEAAGYDPKGFWAQMLSEFGKGMARAGDTVSTSGADLLAGGSMVGGDAAGGFAPVPADSQERFQQGMEARGKRGVIFAEIENLVAGTVDPVKPVLGWMNDTVERGLIKGPGAVAPFMAASVALGPYGAGVLFTADFAEQNRRDLVISGMDEGQARVIGMAAAPLQAVTESLSNALQLGRFPAVQKVLAGFTKPIGGGAGLITRYVQNSAISLGTEFTEEQLQDNVIVPATQELLGALQSDVPDVDWSMYRNRAIESTPELLSVLAPMALVFGGTMTAAQANVSAMMIDSQDMLELTGLSSAQANSVRIQPTEEAKIAKARELWGQRAGTPKSIEDAAKSLGERMKLLQTDHMAAQLELERRGILPRMLRSAEDNWRLTFSDGSTADFHTHQDADAARWQWATDQLGKVHVAVQRTLRQMEGNAAVGREFALQFSPEERYATPEEMATKDFQDRVKQSELLDEVRPEQQYSDAVAIDKASGDDVATKILGSSVNTFKDGVLTTTMKLYHGADITTLVEEKLEGDAKAIMSDPDGRQWMLEHMRSYENASGDKLFASDNDADITDKMLAEAWSHVGQSYLVGKSTNAKAWPARTARRMFSYVLNAGLSPVMNAETQYWRAVALRAQKLAELQKAGKLGEDLTAELERQLGIDSQMAHEAAVADGVASEVASFSEENPGPNGETFSARKFPLPPGLAEAAQKARGESSMILAYQAAQRGSSSAMVPIRSVYEQAKKYQPALTPAQFMEQINALNDSGKILVGLSETMKAVEAAGEFRVGGAGTEMAFAPQETFSVRVTPAQDADYLAAVQAGDMETAQAMVDEAAKKAGYDVGPVFHGTKGDKSGKFPFYVFDTKRRGKLVTEADDPHTGSFFTEVEKYAKGVALYQSGMNRDARAVVGRFYLKNPRILDRGDEGWKNREFVADDPSQIKFADPVTYDDAGNVIPLSQRFNPSRDEITYSLRSGDFSSRMAAAFSPFQRSPELRRLMGKLAHERVMRAAADKVANFGPGKQFTTTGLQSLLESPGWIENRTDELMEQWLEGLTPAARQAYEAGLQSIEDHPLIKEMRGQGLRIMRRATALKQGLNIVDGKETGDYNGMPNLPASLMAKSGFGALPDKIAQAIHDAAPGLMPDGHADTLWDALSSVIRDVEDRNATFQDISAKFKAAKKEAMAKAKAEAPASPAYNAEQRKKMKEMIRVLDAILSAVPPEVRPRVGGYARVPELDTDAKTMNFIENRIAKLDVELSKWLKKEYLEQITKLFKRFAPKKDDKGRITSRITAEAAEDIGFAFEFASLDDANQEKEMAALEKTLEESEDAAEIQDAIGKLAIANLFHKLEEREASELEAAALWLEELGSGAREARKIIDAARAEWVKEAKDAAKADAANGRLSSLPDAENVEADARSSTFKRFTNDVKGFLNSALFTIGQQLELVFGQDSRITTEFHRRAVRAANDSTDIKRDIETRRADFVAKLFGTTSRIKQAGRMGALTVPTASGVVIATGGKTKIVDVPAEIIERIVEGTADLKALGLTTAEAATLADAWADSKALPANRRKRVFQVERQSKGKDVELTMSQDDAIQYLLWSKQKASREQMERDGWSKESFEQLDAFLSDDARALAGFFADEYARIGRLIEPVYRRMFHAPFPQVRNYSPIFRDISGADSIIDIDQQGHGSGVSSGFILARNKNARSAMRRTSAISAFMQHAQSAAHWISHVELVRDLRSVLTDKEVQNAIRSSGRTAAANGIKKRVMQLENQGKVGAAGIAELDSWGSRLLQARAFKGLAWRISPVMKQTSAFFNPLLADVPAWDYMRGTARLLSGELNVTAMWQRPEIQRRIIGGFSAEARIAMDRLGYTGSTMLAAMGKGMMPMALVDAAWTTAGAAIAFDYYRRNNIKSGMNETQAESAALDQLEMMIAESAQPADPANRSLIEGLQNPWLKSMWMFASESRKTLAVEIMALRRLATGKSKNKAMDVQRAVVAHVVMGTTTQLMAGVLSLLMGDDDDKEREWSVEEWASAIVAGPINGLFLFGDAFNYIGRRLFGLHAFEPSTAIGQAIKTVSYAPDNLDKVINGDPEEQRKAFLRLSEAVGQAAAALVGPGNPFTAADVILGNPLRDLAKALGD